MVSNKMPRSFGLSLYSGILIIGSSSMNFSALYDSFTCLPCLVWFGKGLLYVFCSVYQCLIINTVVVFCFLCCSYSEIKVDCITVNTIPIKSFIDDLIQTLFDALLTSLRKSISADVTTIDTFVSEAIDTLSTRPQTVEEIGEASGKHAEFSKKKKEV